MTTTSSRLQGTDPGVDTVELLPRAETGADGGPLRSGGEPSPSRPLTYTVEVERTGPGVSTCRARTATVRSDTSAGLADDLFGPADLLGAAFGSCLLKGVERFSRLLPFRYEAAKVTVTLEREDRPPRVSRIRYRLELVTDEPPRRVALLERNLLRYGTVFNTLARSCEIEGEVVVETKGDAARASRPNYAGPSVAP